jgi:hypothetical protein
MNNALYDLVNAMYSRAWLVSGVRCSCGPCANAASLQAGTESSAAPAIDATPRTACVIL